MHASDRYLAEGTIEDLRKEEDSVGYAKRLRHGEIGQGMNDYDAIFGKLAGVGFDGWISIEDGVDGIEQLQRSAIPAPQDGGILAGQGVVAEASNAPPTQAFGRVLRRSSAKKIARLFCRSIAWPYSENALRKHFPAPAKNGKGPSPFDVDCPASARLGRGMHRPQRSLSDRDRRAVFVLGPRAALFGRWQPALVAR